MTILIDIIISIDATEGRKMKRRLSAVEARKKLGEILDGVYYRGDEVVIERAGKPLAVVVPARLYEQHQRNQKDAAETLMAISNRLYERNKDVPREVLEAEIDEAIEEVRAEMAAERKAGKAAEKSA
jgi:prevent-host-death family protein